MGRCGSMAVLLVLALAGAHAKIEVARVDTDDRSLIPLTEAFGFGSQGHIDLILSDIAIYRRHDAAEDEEVNPDNFGFFLSSAEEEMALEQDLQAGKCLLTERQHVLLTFKEPGVQKLIDRNSTLFTLHVEAEASGWYYLYFANCQPETPVSFTYQLALYNVNSKTGKKEYLSVGEAEIDIVYWVMFALFTVLTAGWAWMLHTHKAAAHKIHYLMLALVVFKALTCLSQALMYYYLEATGKADGWNVAYYIFTFFRGLLFFTVVVLIGTGWSYMKPFIDDNTKRILMVVVPLQVFANIAIVITTEESPAVRDWFTWQSLFHLVDIICCCAILFPIVWSIKHLQVASQTDGKAARVLEKLTLFRQFYVTVVIYIYFTRIVVFLLHNTVEYQYAWVSDAAGELATLAFYVWTGLNFRPHTDNKYFKLSQEELQEIEL